MREARHNCAGKTPVPIQNGPVNYYAIEMVNVFMVFLASSGLGASHSRKLHFLSHLIPVASTAINVDNIWRDTHSCF